MLCFRAGLPGDAEWSAEACVGDDGTADVTAGSDEMFYSLPEEGDEYEVDEGGEAHA